MTITQDRYKCVAKGNADRLVKYFEKTGYPYTVEAGLYDGSVVVFYADKETVDAVLKKFGKGISLNTMKVSSVQTEPFNG